MAGPRPAVRRAERTLSRAKSSRSRTAAKTFPEQLPEFDPAEYDFEILSLIFRARGFDEGAVDADDHMVGGRRDGRFLGDLGPRFRFDLPPHRQDPIARRRVVETRKVREKLIQNIGSLLDRITCSRASPANASTQVSCDAGRAMATGDEAAERPQAQASKRGA